VILEDVGVGRRKGHVDHRTRPLSESLVAVASISALVSEDASLQIGVRQTPMRGRAMPAIDLERRQLEHGATEQRDVVEAARHQPQRVERNGTAS